MPTSPVFLVVEGNTAEASGRILAQGGQPYATQYFRVLADLLPGATHLVLNPADGPAALPSGLALTDLDGVVITGSALNIPDGGPAIERQIELARAIFAAQVPFFGSCWGLQVAAAAAGGTVRANPRGREVAIARKITRTAAGAGHPLLSHRDALAWDALAIHRDEVERLPPDAEVLASNALSQVQAAEIRHDGGSFWGVQYHPEFDLPEIARTLERLAPGLVSEGFAPDAETLAAHTALYATLGADPTRADIAWRLGLDRDILDTATHRSELRAWIDHRVLPRLAARGRG